MTTSEGTPTGDLNRHLLEAVRSNDTIAVAKAISDGADVNTREPWWRRTPLHIAASNNNTEILGLLLRHGADARAKDRSLLTAQDTALAGHRTEAFVMLSNIPGPYDGVAPLHPSPTKGDRAR